jgi:carboxypeptidase PM20D1
MSTANPGRRKPQTVPHGPSAGKRQLRRRVLVVLSAPFILLLSILLIRTAAFHAPKPSVTSAARVSIPNGAVQRLAGSIRLPTISHQDPAQLDSAAFQALHRYLEAQFPRAHSELQREVVATHSLLYTWLGTDPSLKPIMLMGHMDVVPVEPGTEAQWEEAPFGGRVANGFVWGRGAIDNKSAVLGTLEAVEMLLDEGFRPARTVYLAYGHDEEVGGTRGAQAIAALLAQRGVELEMVLDEGGVIGDGLLPGVSSPTALVGIAEKGYVSLELSARAPGGHSSLPPAESAIGILGLAVARLEENPFPARLDGPTRQMFDRVGPRLPVIQRAAFANLWLTRPLVLSKLEETPTTNAMVRTTTATTIFRAGTKENVLPSQARAVVNFRILPGDSIAGVIDHVRWAIDDPRVAVRRVGAFWAEPSPVSSTRSRTYQALERTIRSVAPDVVVAPYLVVVVADARYFRDLSSNIFRFLPVRLKPRDLARMHGTNERLATADYEQAIRMYRQLIIDGAGTARAEP